MPLRESSGFSIRQEERRIFPLGKIRLAQQFRGKLRKKVIKLFGLSKGRIWNLSTFEQDLITLQTISAPNETGMIHNLIKLQ